MRLPKKVYIAGKTFIVVSNKEHDGGSVDFEKLIIEIGTADPSEVAENLLHEVGEAIAVLREFRFAAEREEKENSDYRFVLTHAEWQLFSKDLAIALRGVTFPKSA